MRILKYEEGKINYISPSAKENKLGIFVIENREKFKRFLINGVGYPLNSNEFRVYKVQTHGERYDPLNLDEFYVNHNSYELIKLRSEEDMFEFTSLWEGITLLKDVTAEFS